MPYCQPECDSEEPTLSVNSEVVDTEHTAPAASSARRPSRARDSNSCLIAAPEPLPVSDRMEGVGLFWHVDNWQPESLCSLRFALTRGSPIPLSDRISASEQWTLNMQCTKWVHSAHMALEEHAVTMKNEHCSLMRRSCVEWAVRTQCNLIYEHFAHCYEYSRNAEVVYCPQAVMILNSHESV